MSKSIFHSVGPAIIIAAVVLGPGTILTSSNVGASLGLWGVAVVAGVTVLMAGMVALAARIGAIYEGSPCDELTARLGRPISVIIGLIVFIVVALFQSSNNIAVVAALEPMLEEIVGEEKAGEQKNTEEKNNEQKNTEQKNSEELLSPTKQSLFLVALNLIVIISLYVTRNLYGMVEWLMKFLVGAMVAAFLLNFIVVLVQPRGYEPTGGSGEIPWLPILGMIGTTFSVAGAFYQAYLVKEKGWGLEQVKEGLFDSVFGISVLGGITAIILMTSWQVFFGRPDPIALEELDDVARQLEPLFGPAAMYIFCIGILAGALSSFVVNSLIGGTVFSDSLGLGARLDQKGPLHLTAIALLVGMGVAIISFYQIESSVLLITLAQALTVIAIPALAVALVYLGTRSGLTEARRVPRPILVIAGIGTLISCGLAVMTVIKVYEKVVPML